MEARPSPRPLPGGRSLAQRLRQLAFFGGILLLLGATGAYLWGRGRLDAAAEAERKLAGDIGRIMTLDETLTMSARMAVAARDPAYERRYRGAVGALDVLLRETLAGAADEAVARAVSATEAANRQLVAAEARAFALFAEERYAEALALLEGEAYREHKARYAAGMEAAFARMTALAVARRETAARWAAGLQLAGALALAFVLAVWLMEQRAQRRRAAAYARELEATVGALAERNRGMRLVLDHVDQGFLTIDLGGVISPERSAIVDRWFGAPAPGATLPAYLSAHAPDFAQWLALGLGELRDGVMPLELLLDQLPRRFTAGARTFDVAYSPLGASGAAGPAGLLVIASDITAGLAHDRATREQRELIALFQQLSTDRAGMEEFLVDAAGMVGALSDEGDPASQRRLVHTLKGNCASYGLESVAALAHTLESELLETDDPMTPEQREAMVARWKEAMARLAPLLGAGRRGILEIERPELEQAMARAAAAAAPRDLRELLASWQHEPMARRFERLARQIASLSQSLGRPPPVVTAVGAGIRLESERWRAFWSAMVHAVRNAIDHGIEDAAERRSAGKPEAGAIELVAARGEGRVAFAIRDDGRGIDWDRVRARAAERGLPCATSGDLVRALFADGLTTRDRLGELSGRGVGLAALREAVDAMGGSIEVESAPGRGTTFRFSFDEARARAAVVCTRSSVRASLLPFPA